MYDQVGLPARVGCQRMPDTEKPNVRETCNEDEGLRLLTVALRVIFASKASFISLF